MENYNSVGKFDDYYVFISVLSDAKNSNKKKFNRFSFQVVKEYFV